MEMSVTARATDYPVFAQLLPDLVLREGRYELRFARSLDELDAVLRLRFEVFNLELGEGFEASFDTGRDIDAFDAICHHLLVVEKASGEIVGTYRLQTSAMALAHRGFYSSTEFELGSLPPAVIDSTIELGRACVARAHRNTQVLFLLWKGLAAYVQANGKRYLFGCSSLTSQDAVEARAVMAYLEAHGHLHPQLRVEPREACRCYAPETAADPAFAVKIPKLFRIYLRHGAKVCGPPAIDRQFRTIDYFVVFDVAAMSEKQVRTFFGSSGGSAR